MPCPSRSGKLASCLEHIFSQVSQFVEEGTAAHTKLVISQPVILKKVLEQGYNAAWSDADVAWTRNPFIMFDKTPDVVLAWADNSNVSAGEIFQHGEFSGILHHWHFKSPLWCLFLSSRERCISSIQICSSLSSRGNQVLVQSLLHNLLKVSSWKGFLPSCKKDWAFYLKAALCLHYTWIGSDCFEPWLPSTSMSIHQ